MVFFLKNAFCGLLLASVCYCILRFNLYVLGTDSNYVDFDPLPYAWFFFFLGSSALFALAWEKITPPPGVQLFLTKALFLFSFFGAVNLFLFEKLNILVQFGTWGQRGMPDRPDEWYWFPLTILAVFFLLLGAFLYLSLGFFRRKPPERKRAGDRSLKSFAWIKPPSKGEPQKPRKKARSLDKKTSTGKRALGSGDLKEWRDLDRSAIRQNPNF